MNRYRIAYDYSGKFTSANPIAEGWQIEELLGENYNDWVHDYQCLFWGELEIRTTLDYPNMMEKIIANVPDRIEIGEVWQLVAICPPPREGWIAGEPEDHSWRHVE